MSSHLYAACPNINHLMATISNTPKNGETKPHPMYNPSEHSKLPRNPVDASALLRSYIPDIAIPITAQLSYGRKAIPNLIRDLKDPAKLPTKQKALVALAELFHSPENVSQAIANNIIPHMTAFITSENITCRQKSSEALKLISHHAIGRNAILRDKNNILKLSKNFDDTDDLTRKNIHDTLSAVTSLHVGVRLIFEFGLFSKLCNKLSSERLDIQVSILSTCYNCIRMGEAANMPSVAIDCNALETFADLAKNSKIVEVQVAACECIMMLCFFDEGKKLASNSETINVLISLLTHTKSEVRAAAAGGLMSISICFDGKRALVRDNALKILGKLLEDSNELVQLNCIKTITNCAEDYRGRFLLHQSLEKLKGLVKNSPNQHIVQAAKQAIDVITWRP